MSASTFLYAEVLDDTRWQFAGDMIEPESWVDTERLPRVPATLVDPELPHRGLTTVLNGGKTPHMVSEIGAALPVRVAPDDLSAELRGWAEYFEAEPEEGGWFTLVEFEAIEWDTRVRMRADVDRRVAHLFEDPEAPFPYSKWPAGLGISYSVPQSGSRFRRRTRPVEWTETYVELARSAHGAIAALGEYGPPDTVRIVWWQFW